MFYDLETLFVFSKQEQVDAMPQISYEKRKLIVQTWWTWKEFH